MHLLAINGSPRGKKSNTKILLETILQGVNENTKCSSTVEYLNNFNSYDQIFLSVSKADIILLVFPLYTDSMPGVVMKFFETLKEFPERIENKKMGFIVQSGFPEVHHSVVIQKYMIKLIKRLKCDFIGSAIFGGIEGIQSRSEEGLKEFKGHLREIGKKLGTDAILDEQIVKSIQQTYKFSFIKGLLFKIYTLFMKSHPYWDRQLKANNAYEKRLDRPYL